MKILVACAQVFLGIIYFFMKLCPVEDKVVMISRQANRPSLDFTLIRRHLLKQAPQIKIVTLCHTLEKRLNAKYIDLIKYGFHMLKQITFEEPDRKTFKGLPMAVEAARAGGSMPTVFNAANELAVRKFLQKKISFLDIYEIIGQSMSRHTAVKDPDLDQILEIEKETYRWIESRW